MSVPLTARAFLAVLRTEGVHVAQVGDWEHHNRNEKGPWGGMHGVMVHHTVTEGEEFTLRECIDGYEGLPGPLYHIVITKDGVAHIIGYGRANHAGLGDAVVLRHVTAELPVPKPQVDSVDGNRHFYGVALENLGDGVDPYPDVQIDTLIRTCTALCRAHGWGKVGGTSVIGHREWTATKIDPKNIDMDDFRDRIRERLLQSAEWTPSTLINRVTLVEAMLSEHGKRLASLEKKDNTT